MAEIQRVKPHEIYPTEEGVVAFNSTGPRDWQQSDLGGAAAKEDIYAVASLTGEYHSRIKQKKFRGAIEVGGGTRPRNDVAVRKESPFQSMRNHMHLTPGVARSALIRSDAGGGMEELAPDILRLYIHLYYDAGNDVFRNFHALNDWRAHRGVYGAVREKGGHYQAAFSFAVCDEDPTIYNSRTPVTFYQELERAGMTPDSDALKDPAGVLTPDMSKYVTRAVKNAQKDGRLSNVPFGIHTHNQTGLAALSCLSAVQAGANFIDGGPAAGGYGAQPAMSHLVEHLLAQGYNLGFDSPEMADEALEALKKVDAECLSILQTKKPDGTFLYDPAIRQTEPDASVHSHGIAGGQSSIARAELLKYFPNDMLAKLEQLKAIIPLVRKEVGQVCQVTPVADYILREAVRRMGGGKPGEGFYCGFARILTGEMGPTKEPVDPIKAQQALYERAVAKYKKFGPQQSLPSEELRQLVSYMWDLAEPVRNMQRLREVQNRIRELQEIQNGPADERDYMNRQIAKARMKNADNLTDVIGNLSREADELQEKLGNGLAARVQSLKERGVNIAQFEGATDAEKYAQMYEAIQRPEFKRNVPIFEGEPNIAHRQNALHALYKDIRAKTAPLFDSMMPAVSVKLIRSAGLTTVSMGEIIPDALDEAKRFLADLHAKGEYFYPLSKRAQMEDLVIIVMLQDPRSGAESRHKLPKEFFLQRDAGSSESAMFVQKLSAEAKLVSKNKLDRQLRSALLKAGFGEHLCDLQVTKQDGNNHLAVKFRCRKDFHDFVKLRLFMGAVLKKLQCEPVSLKALTQAASSEEPKSPVAGAALAPALLAAKA